MLSEATGERIEYWSIHKLVFYSKNARKWDAAVDHVAASIREYEFKSPAAKLWTASARGIHQKQGGIRQPDHVCHIAALDRQMAATISGPPLDSASCNSAGALAGDGSAARTLSADSATSAAGGAIISPAAFGFRNRL
jgi:hypothetical protein